MRVRCCIAGGGPAGMMLGVLLARAGVEVVVLEKHKDFLRDFRGDTIHPSTLEVMHELGVLDEFLRRPHQEVRQLTGQVENEALVLADFSFLSTKCKFIAFMPQWDFLDFLADLGRTFPTFHIRMQTEATDLLREGNRVTGVKTLCGDQVGEIYADLVVGADGRSSKLRDQSGLTVVPMGAPIDVLWFRLSRKSVDGGQTLGRIRAGKMMVMLNREEYWQCAFVIPKGEFAAIQQRGLEAFRKELEIVAPVVSDRTTELTDWSDIKLLTVIVDRLEQWQQPGLLFIGDAAHAMSPIGGVGINLAIQDAVAAANLLAAPLRSSSLSERHVRRVQRRRMFPTRLTQRMQVLVQNRVISRVLGTRSVSIPKSLKLLLSFKFTRRVLARVVGIGFRPEHVKTRNVFEQEIAGRP